MPVRTLANTLISFGKNYQIWSSVLRNLRTILSRRHATQSSFHTNVTEGSANWRYKWHFNTQVLLEETLLEVHHISQWKLLMGKLWWEWILNMCVPRLSKGEALNWQRYKSVSGDWNRNLPVLFVVFNKLWAQERPGRIREAGWPRCGTMQDTTRRTNFDEVSSWSINRRYATRCRWHILKRRAARMFSIASQTFDSFVSNSVPKPNIKRWRSANLYNIVFPTIITNNAIF